MHDNMGNSMQTEMSGKELPFSTSMFAVFLCMLFGANPVAVKTTLTGIGIFTSAGIRFGIAAAVLCCWAKVAGISLYLSTRQVLQMAGLGLIFFIQISLFYSGMSRTTASHGALIANTVPFVVMILAHFLLPDDKINPKKINGLLLGFAGVFLLIRDSLDLTAEAFSGDCLLFLAVLFWGCNVIYVKKIIADFNPIQITVFPMIFTVPLYLLAGYLLDGGMVREVTPMVIQAVLYQSLVTASFGFVMWNSLIQKYGATTLHCFLFLMPVSGVLLGVLVLGDPISYSLAASIILVASGLIVINWKSDTATV